MYYKIELNDHIRVPPKLFHLTNKEAVIQRIKKGTHRGLNAV